MKRYANLFERVCSLSNIAEAHCNARAGKAHYRAVKMVDADQKSYFEEIRRQLESKTYKTSPYSTLIKKDYGKPRLIHKLPYFPDRIVHHAVVQVVAPIWVKTMIRDTYACIQGRGIHDGMRRVKKALKDFGGTQFCLKMDAKKFYPSMDHDALKVIVRRKIKDSHLLWLLDEIIDSLPGQAGVPIGNYLSQFFANLYLSDYDHWMKEVQGCKYYFRYCDDVIVLDADKARLHELKKLTADYWGGALKLSVKGNWQVFPVDSRGIDFLGYRFFHGYILLRKSIAAKFKRKIAGIKQDHADMAPISIASSIMSYRGWMVHANCRNLQTRHIDREVNTILGDALFKIKQEALNAKSAH